MSSENDIVKDVVEGATKGALDFGKEEVAGWIYKLRNKDLLFIGRKSSIELLKKQRYTEEWSLFDKYIESKDLRIIVQLGLTLRDLEDDVDEIKRIQDVIKDKYAIQGLHIAYFVQNGFLSNYIGVIITENISKNALKEELEDTLRNIDKYIVFISNQENIEKMTNILKNRIEINLPKVLMLYSIKSAVKIAKQIKESLEKEIEHYKISDTTLEGDKYICFFIRDDNFYREEAGYLV